MTDNNTLPDRGAADALLGALAQRSQRARESTLRRLRAVPPGCEAFRPDPGAMSVADLASHLARSDEALVTAAGSGRMARNLGEATATAPGRSDYLALVARLEASGRRRTAMVLELDAAALRRPIVADRKRGVVELPLLALILEMLDHEAYHRGQLASYLRLIEARG